MNTVYYTAIVFFSPFLKQLPRKYRNIRDTQNFERFCRQKLNGAVYYNLYNKNTKEFVRREYLV